MYGLVNQAVRDLVVTKFGEEKWNAICDEARSPVKEFVNMQYYPDALTYALVGAASSQLGLPANAILSEFGKYWILYTAKTGYGPIMDLFGKDYKSCLAGLNNLHARMGLSMPELTPPRFDFIEIAPNVYQIEYQSKRGGLEPFVQGLLEGLAQKFNTAVEIDFRITDDNRRIFSISVLG